MSYFMSLIQSYYVLSLHEYVMYTSRGPALCMRLELLLFQKYSSRLINDSHERFIPETPDSPAAPACAEGYKYTMFIVSAWCPLQLLDSPTHALLFVPCLHTISLPWSIRHVRRTVYTHTWVSRHFALPAAGIFGNDLTVHIRGSEMGRFRCRLQ